MNQKTLKEFRLAIKEDYGIEISLEEASLILTDLTEYFSTLAKIQRRIAKKD